MSKLNNVAEQMAHLESWLNENAPEVFDDQRHLDDGEERKYWNYGRFIALRDVMRVWQRIEPRSLNRKTFRCHIRKMNKGY